MILRFVKKQKILSVMVLVYLTLWLLNLPMVMEALNHTGYFIKEMVEIMPVIFVLTALVEAWVPRKAIENSFGDHTGFMGMVRALILGSLSAGPIYAAFPVCRTLLKKGASVGNVVVILSAWAVIKVPMLANEAKFLGLPFMAIRWLLTVASIFLMAWWINRRIQAKAILDLTADDPVTAYGILSIQTDTCIGCGVCVRLEPDIFSLEEGKISLKSRPKEDLRERLQVVALRCPAKTIQVT